MKAPILGYPQFVAFGISLAAKTKLKNQQICDLQPECVLQRAPWAQCGDKGGRTDATEKPSEKVFECFLNVPGHWAHPEGKQTVTFGGQRNLNPTAHCEW